MKYSTISQDLTNAEAESVTHSLALNDIPYTLGQADSRGRQRITLAWQHRGELYRALELNQSAQIEQ